MKYLLVCLGVITVTGIIAWYQLTTDVPLHDASARTEIIPDQSTAKAETPLAANHQIDLTKTGVYTAPRPANAGSTSAIWEEMDESVSAPTIRKDVPDLKLFAYSRDRFINLSAGDTVHLGLPEPGHMVEMWVERVFKNPSGSLTLKGKVDGNANYSFSMTLGDKSTYATIDTASGIFNLRGNDTHVWIGLGRSFNHHVNPETPDYRIIEPEQKMESNS